MFVCLCSPAVSVGTVFDQFGGGGLGGWDRQGERGGQGGAGGTVGFGPAIEDFTGAGGATGGREGRAGEGRSVESLGGEVQPRTSLVGDATALGPMLPSVGQLVPRINIDLVEQVRQTRPHTGHFTRLLHWSFTLTN